MRNILVPLWERFAEKGKNKKKTASQITVQKVEVFSSTQPQGGKPSDCAKITIGGTWQMKLENAAAHVDAVHGIDVVLLPSLPFEVVNIKHEEAGYEVTPQDNLPVRFMIDRHNDHPEMSFAHEIGHHLDLWGLGRGGHWASSQPSGDGDLLGEWREAVDASPETQVLRESLNGGHALILQAGEWRNTQVSRSYVQYLLQRNEQFARSYAQYIAVKTQSPQMLAQLDKLRARTYVYGVKHWSDENFKPIESAFDKLFKQLRWIT